MIKGFEYFPCTKGYSHIFRGQSWRLNSIIHAGIRSPILGQYIDSTPQASDDRSPLSHSTPWFRSLTAQV